MAMSAFALDAVSGAPKYTGKMLRGALSALLGSPPSGRPLGATSGVRPGTPSTTVSVSGLTVTVAPHAGVLDVQADATTGPYLYAVTASETVTLNAAHATYARWDRISVRLSDPAAGDGTSVPGIAIVYTAGTPSAAPAMPAEPARSMTLARVVVPQAGGGAASVVWMAPETGSGGVCWYPDTGARDVALGASPPRDTIAIIGSGATMQITIWDGTAWKVLGSQWQSYTPTITGVTLGAGGSVAGAWHYTGMGEISGYITLTLGTGGVFTGVLNLGLPLAVTGVPTISGIARDASSAARRALGAFLATASTLQVIDASTGLILNVSSPWTWTADDSVQLAFTARV